MPRALIVGSGVAGPAVAQFLQLAGWDTEIFEASNEPDDYGGLFLNVATNGLSVLESLGLRERLVAGGHRAPHMVMQSSTGKVLGTVPNGPARDPDRGGVVVKRGWLHQVIRDGAAAAGIPIRYGAALVSIDETADAVRAEFADGSIAQGDILIGADGIGSVTRTWIDSAAPRPEYSGLVGLGGFAHVPGLEPTPETQYMVFGTRSFFGYLVREDGTVYWFANVTSPGVSRSSLRHVSSSDWLAQLKELHAGDPYPVPQILDHVEGEIRGYPIDDLTGVPRWSRGRVVAIGDAVHATSPSAGQGASMALEDAITLVRCLRREPDHGTAFAEFQSLRQPRTDAIVEYARTINAQKRVTKSRIGIAIRDVMLPTFLRKAANDNRNDWLYNHTIEWEPPTASDAGADSRSTP